MDTVKIKRTFSLEAKTVKRLEEIATKEKRNLSTIVDLAIHEYFQR